MKLRPPQFSQVPALILLGSLMVAPAVVMGNDYDYEENDDEAAYRMDDIYGDRDSLHRASQPMLNGLEDDDYMPNEWDSDDDEEYEDDDQSEEDGGGYGGY